MVRSGGNTAGMLGQAQTAHDSYSPLPIMNYDMLDQTGKAIIVDHEEFKCAQSE